MSHELSAIAYAAGAPGYWMYETSGVLRPAIIAYLSRADLTEQQIAAMRAYLRQWIMAPGWRGAFVESLRSQIDGLTTRARIRDWIDQATDAGADPL